MKLVMLPEMDGAGELLGAVAAPVQLRRLLHWHDHGLARVASYGTRKLKRQAVP